MKVVVTKLRLQSSLSTQQLQIHKAVRATLILFPLLGMTNLLFFINPKAIQRDEHEFLYMLINSVLKSSQVENILSKIILSKRLDFYCFSDRYFILSSIDFVLYFWIKSSLRFLVQSLTFYDRASYSPICIAFVTQKFKTQSRDFSEGSGQEMMSTGTGEVISSEFKFLQKTHLTLKFKNSNFHVKTLTWKSNQ